MINFYLHVPMASIAIKAASVLSKKAMKVSSTPKYPKTQHYHEIPILFFFGFIGFIKTSGLIRPSR